MSETRKRRLEITIETRQLTIIRKRGEADFVYCQNCQTNVRTLSPARAALIFRVDLQEIERLFQAGQIHAASESALCGDSLAGYFKTEIRYFED